MKLPAAATTDQPEQQSTTAKRRSRDDVIDKSASPCHPHHHHQRRFTPDSGVELTDVKSCSHFDQHAFEHSFHGFPTSNSSANLSSACGSERTSFSGCIISGPTSDGDFRTTAKSTLLDHSGHCTVTTRDVLNGEETVVIEQDGIVTTNTLNGRPIPCVTSV